MGSGQLKPLHPGYAGQDNPRENPKEEAANHSRQDHMSWPLCASTLGKGFFTCKGQGEGGPAGDYMMF